MPHLNFAVDEELKARIEAFAAANSLSTAAAARFLIHRGLAAAGQEGGQS